MFRVEFTPQATDDIRSLRKYDHRRVLNEIGIHLAHEPGRETRRRKRLRPNLLAEWELRIEEFRVFYDVTPAGPDDTDEDEGTVRVVAIGWKEGSTLFVHGQEFEL